MEDHKLIPIFNIIEALRINSVSPRICNMDLKCSFKNYFPQCGITGENNLEIVEQSQTMSKGTTFPTSKNCNYILQWENEVRTSTYHTVILPDWTLKKWALSSFAFQFFQGFIETPNKKIFLNPVRDFWDNPNYPLLSTFVLDAD